MPQACYTYRVHITNRDNVQVEIHDPAKSLLGEPSGDLGYKSEAARIQELCQTARKGKLTDSTVQELGERLFATLLDEGLCRDFFGLYKRACHEGVPLRLELDVDERQLPDVAALPWEFMRVPSSAGYGTIWLGTDPNLAFSRRRARWITPQPINLKEGERLRIALAVANPTGLGMVKYARVWNALKELSSSQPKQIELLELVNPATRQAIDTVLEQAPHIFHFIGHARLKDENHRDSGQIALVDVTDQPDWMEADDFSELFTRHRPGVVVLQACEGAAISASQAFVGVASQVVQQDIPVVVAMQYKVSNSTARRFVLEFYEHLAKGESIDKAAQEGRRSIALGTLGYSARDFATPVLFMRVRDGHLFHRPTTELGEQASKEVQTYRLALTQQRQYARWADRHDVQKDTDHYIPTESKILPLFASPYDDDTGQQRENLLTTIRNHDRLLILGEPGVGKTAALERMVWETTNTRGSVVPIYVPLSHYNGDLLAEVRYALMETGKLHFGNLRDVDTFLRQHQCLVLFDGLNEVRGDQRRQVVKDIAHFVRAYRRHHYVVTSRSQDPLWQKLRDEGIIRHAVVVQPITDTQVREYLIAHLGPQEGTETHDSLNECLRGMSRTPLFLWMLKEVRQEGREIPGNRGELFDQFVETLFNRDEGKLEISTPRSAKKQALAYLAFILHKERRMACPEEEAIAIASRVEENHEAQVLIHEAQVHGLLKRIERERKQVRFMHQAVQEYFVALDLREKVAAEVDEPAWQQFGKRLLRLGLAAWARDDWWAESLVQLAGLTDHVSWLVQEIVRVNPWLAFWCMIEGGQVDQETQRSVKASTVDLLRSDDVRERQHAVQELGKLKNPRTATYLVEALGDEVKVVNVAVQGLGKLGEPAVEPLRRCLKSNNIEVRRAATRALGLAWQLPPLVDLGQNSKRLRLAALETLGQIGDTRAIEAIVAVARWDTAVAVQQRAIETLGQLGDTRATGTLLAILADDKPSLRASAATALGKVRDKRAVESLTQALQDSDQIVRRKAISALGQIWEWPQLGRLGDDNENVQQMAAAALGQQGDRRAVQSLVAALRDKNETVCASAAEALGQLEASQAVEPLISVLLTRKEAAARTSAAAALGELGDRRAIKSLIVALKDQEKSVRRNATTALGQLRAKEAIEPLLKVCAERDVQESAVEALAQIGRPALLPLIMALQDGAREGRICAIRVLGQIGGAEAVKALVATLRNDQDKIVRISAARALRQIGSSEAIKALITALRSDKDESVRTRLVIELGQLESGRAVQALVVTLREDRDRIVRATAAISLGRIGGAQAIEALTNTLKDKDEDEAVWRVAIGVLGLIWDIPQLVRLSEENETVRQDAATALGQQGDKRAIEPLKATLRDRDENVRYKATCALGQIWNLPQLVRLGDSEAKVRQRAALALGKIHDARATEPLTAFLKDGNPGVRWAAAQALGQLGDERAVDPLIEALDDSNKYVQRAAAEALQRLAPWAMPRLIAALRDSSYWFRRRKAAETLAQIGEPSSLIEALRHHDRHVRRSAAEALVKRTESQAVIPLIDALEDDDNYVRRKAAEALGKIQDPHTVKPLIKVLEGDEDWYVRRAVTEAMGDIGHPSAVASLIAALEDDEWPVREMAAKALGKIRDPRAVGPLIEALEGDWPALWRVAEALGQLEHPRAVGSLAAALKSSEGDHYVQQAAIEALGRIGEPIQKPLIAVLRDRDERARQRAIAALGQMRDARNLQPLIQALRDKDFYVHQGAMEALIQLGEAAVEPLVSVLRDQDAFVRRRAVGALGQIRDPRAVNPLTAILKKDPLPLVRQEAAKALRSIDTPKARAAIQKHPIAT